MKRELRARKLSKSGFIYKPRAPKQSRRSKGGFVYKPTKPAKPSAEEIQHRHEQTIDTMKPMGIEKVRHQFLHVEEALMIEMDGEVVVGLRTQKGMISAGMSPAMASEFGKRLIEFVAKIGSASDD